MKLFNRENKLWFTEEISQTRAYLQNWRGVPYPGILA